MRALALLVAVAVVSCAAPTHHAARVVDDKPLVTRGARCPGGQCTCRNVDSTGASLEGDNAEGPVAAGSKRFELRTGRGTDEVAITVEGLGTLKKASEPIEAACGYIDLPPGMHRVHLAIKGGPSEGGASPKVLIYEYGNTTHSWYTSFGITCGETGPCTDADLHERMANLAAAHGLFDRCGSVKVRDLRWDSRKGADDRVTSVDVDFTLEVYNFDPRFPRGGACKGPSPN